MSVLRKIFAKVSGKPEQQLKNEALRKAALKGNFTRAQKLLAEGADVDYRDVNSLTPLYFAASHGFNDITKLLLEHGATPDVGKDKDLEGSALTQAAYWGYFDVVKTLVEYKADLNLKGYELRSALHEAIWKGREEIAAFLVEAGTKTDTQSRMGTTPLQDAVLNDLRRTAVALCRHGADASVTDRSGDTVRDIMTRKGWDDAVAAIDAFAQEQAEKQRRALEEERQRKEGLAAAIESAPVLQSDLVVKKPIVLKSGS
ncbi:MAG: ankyrin repeat domain-containing protein [Alphaproteobacteria bacterium]|nr:MAG: ankyrin repeat domain-containing protein [Alphaproteobacteria bacterium]